jgi:hypothetical protein
MLEETSNILACLPSECLSFFLIAFCITDILLYCTRKLKLNQLHVVLEELLNIFDAPSRILPEEQEARATVALFQSLLSGDDKSDVSDIANRLSEWIGMFLT